MHAEADSASAVPDSPKVCVRRPKAAASEMRTSAETSTTTAATRVTATTKVTAATKSSTTTVRSSPRYGA